MRHAWAAVFSVLCSTTCPFADAAATSPASQPATTSAPAASLPIRAFHAQMPKFWGGDGRPYIADCEKFIREVLAPAGVNVLILEVGYNFQYKSYPKIGNANAIGPDEVKRLLKVCRENNIKLIPQLNCLGHQSTALGSLLGEYPELREPDGKLNKYCTDPYPPGKVGASYCPLHPDVHKIMFALQDELADVFEADTLLVGMDEVFDIASTNCPRCAGKDPSVLFADEAKALHDHLAQKGLKMWMWGDRLLRSEDPNFKDKGWESSQNGTERAIDLIPKDIVICDWHYDHAPNTPEMFARKGFDVIACCWWTPEVALKQVDMIRALAADSDPAVAAHAKGEMLTVWVEMQYFIDGYYGRIPPVDQWTPEQRKRGFPWRAAERSNAVLKVLSPVWQ